MLSLIVKRKALLLSQESGGVPFFLNSGSTKEEKDSYSQANMGRAQRPDPIQTAH
jgi:hypothetical protein